MATTSTNALMSCYKRTIKSLQLDTQAQLDSFKLLAPSNTAQNQNFKTLALDWSDAYGASAYELLLDVSPAFNSNLQSYNCATSNYSLSNLAPNKTYYWKVRASDGSNWGNYSSTWSFKTNALENFNLISPAANALNVNYSNLLFDWSDNLGADRYELQIDSNSNFTNPSSYNSSNSNYSISNLIPATTYYWKVRAISNSYTGNWLNSRSFKTKAAVGIQDFRDKTIVVYPNMAQNNLNVILPEAIECVSYSIYSQDGRLMLSGHLDSKQSDINISHLVNGVYYLKIDNFQTQTFIKG